MNNQQFEFESTELRAFEKEINERSEQLIDETIKKYSPIQLDDIVTEWYACEGRKLKVTNIKIFIIDYVTAFSETSFSYEGVPVKMDGTPMKNRKPIWFSSFVFNGVKYSMPSYNRKEIIIATMIKK